MRYFEKFVSFVIIFESLVVFAKIQSQKSDSRFLMLRKRSVRKKLYSASDIFERFVTFVIIFESLVVFARKFEVKVSDNQLLMRVNCSFLKNLFSACDNLNSEAKI